MRSFPRGRAGSTLILNFLVMTVFAMTAVVVYAAAKSQIRAVVHDAREAEAQAIAEGGLEDALHGLYLDPQWRAGYAAKPFADGFYTVTLTTAASPVIASTGYSSSLLLLGRAVKTVTATAVIVSSGAPGKAIVANGLSIVGNVDAYNPSVSLTPSSASFTSGAVIWSNGGIDTNRAACPPIHVLGDASYFTTAPGAACVSGGIDHSTYTIALTGVPCGNCQTVNNNLAGISPSSAYNVSAMKLTVSAGQTVTLSSGTYFFTQVFINGNGILNVDTTTGPVKIFYNNKWQESSSCAVNNLSKIPSRLLISDIAVSSHKVDLSCPAPLHAYMEGGTTHFTLHSPTEVYGHIFADIVTIDDGAKLHFDLGAGVTVSHVAWTTGAAGSWAESYQRQ